MEKEYNLNFVYIIAISLVSALGGLLYGYDLVVIGGAKEFYELTYGLNSPSLQGWAVSSCIVGCIFGALFVGKAADKYGRKPMLIIAALFFFVSAIGSGYAPTFNQFILYRLLGGIGMGMASAVSPMYIAEVSPAKYRGRFVSLNQLTIVLGILLAQFVNYAIVQSHPLSTALEASRPLVISMEQNLAKLDETSGSVAVSDLLSKDQIEVVKNGAFLQGLPIEVADSTVLVNALNSGTVRVDAESLPLGAMRAYYDTQLLESWNGQTGWRWMFGAEAIPAVFFFGFMIFVPFSPRWLVKNGRDAEAERVLLKIGGESYAK